jgi:hypothetical protein
MKDLHTMSLTPENKVFKKGDLLVIYGEVFEKGYVNGLIEEAKKIGMSVVAGTVGRRDEHQNLRVLTEEELSQKTEKTINTAPLEAGFDLCKGKEKSPVDQLYGVKRDEWNTVKLDWDEIHFSLEKGKKDFEERSLKFLDEVFKNHYTEGQNVHFAHTMAGGIPRAKILMPLLNRVFKGTGKRFLSSKEFWDSEIGKLCSLSFNEVTARTFEVLIGQTKNFRDISSHVSYSAYGYHGCSPLLGDSYEWQSYAPYLQGWAKTELENVAKKYWKDGLKTQVFNSPEILTNSSSVFMGVEVCLYPLLRSLKYENKGQDTSVHKVCAELLNNKEDLNKVDEFTQTYMNTNPEQQLQDWQNWPTHNSTEQMFKTQEASKFLIDLHKDKNDLMTLPLSEVVFKTTGKAILCEASKPEKPVWWLGHELVSKTHLAYFE